MKTKRNKNKSLQKFAPFAVSTPQLGRLKGGCCDEGGQDPPPPPWPKTAQGG